MAQAGNWNWWASLAQTIFGGSIGGASKKEKIARQGAILQESWKPCPPGYYAAKYSGPNKNTVQCYIDPNYVAPPPLAPEPTPEPEPPPATPAPTPEPLPEPTPTPTPTPPAPRPGDNPLTASPGALDWDPRAYGAGAIFTTKVKGKLPKLPPLPIQKGGLPQTVPGAKVKRVGTTAYKAAETIKAAKAEKIFRDPLIKPRVMPKVNLPAGSAVSKMTVLGAAARAGNIVGLILTPGKLGNSDVYREPYPTGRPVRSSSSQRNSADRGRPISAASKARLERIGVIPRSTANRAASKLPPTVELQPIAITARRTAVAAPVPKANPRPTTARTPVARAPAAAPTPAWKRLITLPKVDWTSLIIGLATKPRDRVSAVTLPLYLSTPTPTPTPTPTSTPTTAPKDDPLTAPTVDPLGSPAGPGYTPPYSTRTSECDCKPKKRKPAKPRTECYKGSYVEKARGLTKTKREKVPCQ